VVITGNEDGAKATTDVLYAMSHIGYTVPPQVDCVWLGEAGPDPSYGGVSASSESPESFRSPAVYDNEFTNLNTAFIAWNLMHMAKMLKDIGGIPAVGNVADDWRHVTNAEDQNPEYR